jgi:HEPN domain-containing protein
MSKHDIVQEWLQIAYDDYDAAQYLFGHKYPQPLEIICYHCQQSVEKSLKAYLCFQGIEVPKTHEVGLLCHRSAEFDNAFEVLFDACEELEIYATGTRYPNRIEVEGHNAEEALRQALEIYNFVFERIQPMTGSRKTDSEM